MKSKEFLEAVYELQGSYVRHKSTTGDRENNVGLLSYDARNAVSELLAKDCNLTMERAGKFFSTATNAQVISYFSSVCACVSNIVGMCIAGTQLDEQNMQTAKRHFDSAASQFRTVVGV